MTARMRVPGWPSLKKWRPDIWTVLLLLAVVYLWFRPPAWVSEEQRSVGDVQISLLDGSRTSLGKLRGKVILVNFWASWCPYCRHEMPAMEEFYRAYRERGFEILALSEDDDPSAAASLMSRETYTFPAARADASSIAAFGGVSRLPTSFLVDKKGMIRYRINGQVHFARLKSLVEPLLAE